jgi:hypothetical protein
MRLARYLLCAPLIVCLILAFLPISASALDDTFYSGDYDGTAYSWSDNYVIAQGLDSENASVEYSTTSIWVGQDATFKVWRGMLSFDTSGLSDRAAISAATIDLYVDVDVSTTDFDVVIVEGGDIHAPPIAADYDVLHDKSTNLTAAINTAAIVEDAYNTFTLTATGLETILTSGTTVFGIRSSLDIAVTEPDSNDYIRISSAESANPPRLNVTYTVSDLGAPETFIVERPIVFTDYIETGDQLYCFATNIKYTSTPEEMPQEWYVAQLLDTDNTSILAQTTVQRWGYQPLSFYLSAASAPTWGEAYMIRVMGTDLFAIPPAENLTLSSISWKGSNYTLMDLWIIGTATKMATEDGLASNGYFASYSGRTVINDAGTEIFSNGIPYITTKRPEKFSLPGESSNPVVPVADTYSDSLYASWDVYWTDKFDDIMNPIGMPGYWLPSIAFAGLSIAAVAYFRKEKPGQVALSYLIAIPIMGIGFMFGVPIWIMVAVMAVAFLFFTKSIFLREM